MIPSEEHIRSLSFNELRRASLSKIKFKSLEFVKCLTFCFGDYVSPPKGTYLIEPDETFDVPVALNLGSIAFGIKRYGCGMLNRMMSPRFSPVNIYIKDQADRSYTQINSKLPEDAIICAIDLRCGEILVAAEVGTSFSDAANIKFLVFDTNGLL
jgi:hypothetical protein